MENALVPLVVFLVTPFMIGVFANDWFAYHRNRRARCAVILLTLRSLQEREPRFYRAGDIYYALSGAFTTWMTPDVFHEDLLRLVSEGYVARRHVSQPAKNALQAGTEREDFKEYALAPPGEWALQYNVFSMTRSRASPHRRV